MRPCDRCGTPIPNTAQFCAGCDGTSQSLSRTTNQYEHKAVDKERVAALEEKEKRDEFRQIMVLDLVLLTVTGLSLLLGWLVLGEAGVIIVILVAVLVRFAAYGFI